MKVQKQFQADVNKILSSIDPEILSYNQDEFWMISRPYEYLEIYAQEKGLLNMAIALPLARGLHNGTYRKSGIIRDGVPHRLPYYIHPLLVCRMLADLNLPLSKEDEDIVLASALCHDLIEDVKLEDDGKVMFTKYGLDRHVYETVALVSKRYDWTESEERDFFHGIETHWPSLLIKLSDRGNNIEDLYNMKYWKVHEYIDETRKYFLPMCEYGLQHYQNLRQPLEILRDKIISLTRLSEIYIDDFAVREKNLQDEIDSLKEENIRLKTEWAKLWEDDTNAEV